MDNSFSEGVEMLKKFITNFSINSKFFKKRKETKKEKEGERKGSGLEKWKNERGKR
jgi:hypothetical protein